MSLTAGAKLGYYEIVAAIGAGGMGEVYRARDKQPGGLAFFSMRFSRNVCKLLR